MANTNLIYTYIQDSGYKLQYVASVLHISSNTLRHKLCLLYTSDAADD